MKTLRNLVLALAFVAFGASVSAEETTTAAATTTTEQTVVEQQQAKTDATAPKAKAASKRSHAKATEDKASN